MTATRIQCHVGAPREAVYQAFLDPAAVATWMVPPGMRSQVHAFEPREGGFFRISLTYEDQSSAGKTTDNTDTYHGRFVELIPNRRIVESIEFETDDPQLRGEMTMIVELSATEGGTDLVALHDNLPPGLSAEDNEIGWRLSLGRLRELLEGTSPVDV